MSYRSRPPLKRLAPLALIVTAIFLIFGSSAGLTGGWSFQVDSVQEGIDTNGHSVSITFSLPAGFPSSSDILIANPTAATNLTKFAPATANVNTMSSAQLASYNYPSAFPPQNGGYETSISGSQVITCEYVFSGTSTTGTIYVGLYSPGAGVWTWAPYVITKEGCTAVSIDSRKMYGQPNVAGELPANQLDPNVPARNINFSGWTFKGGLFVGHAPTTTQDESGTARIQAYVTPLTGHSLLAACVSMYWLSNATNFADAYTLQAYSPDSSDPNYNYSDSAHLTWTNGSWNLALPHVSNLGTYAMNTTWLPNSYFAAQILGGSTNANGVMPVALAMNPEPAPGNTPKTWSYFVTPAYEQQTGVTDKEPKAWFVYEGTYYNGTFPTTSTTGTSSGGTTGIHGTNPPPAQ